MTLCGGSLCLALSSSEFVSGILDRLVAFFTFFFLFSAGDEARFLISQPSSTVLCRKKHENKGFLIIIFFHFVALLMVINFKQSILSGKVDEGYLRSTSWLTAAKIYK